MLVDTHARGVDRDLPVDLAAGIGPDLKRAQDLVPGPIGGEPVVPLPHRLPRTELSGQITPGNTGAIAVDRALDQDPVITHRSSHRTFGRRQYLLDLAHIWSLRTAVLVVIRASGPIDAQHWRHALVGRMCRWQPEHLHVIG
jgi:hypothetical protein